MRVLQNGDVFLATRITGPSHNMLALDFTHDRTAYMKNLAELPEGAVTAESVREQVLSAFDEVGVPREDLVGVQFDATDTPSDSVYVELARLILEVRASGAEVEPFVPAWAPSNACSEAE